MRTIRRRAILLAMAVGAAGGVSAQSLTTLASAPVPGPDDISQLSTSGNVTWPDSLNCFTDDSAPAGQTFTTGASPMKLKSVAIKTAGLKSGGSYGTPANTTTCHLRIYSVSGGTATQLISFSAAARVERVPEGPLRAAAVESLLSQWRQSDPVAATSWQSGS